MGSFEAALNTQEPQSSNDSRNLLSEQQQSEETPWDKLPFGVRQNIMQRFEDPTEKKSAIKSLRQAGPTMRKFANETITHVNLNGSAEAGGTLKDLPKFPEVSILECDFSKNIGEVSELGAFLERKSNPILLELANLDAVDVSTPTVLSPDRAIDAWLAQPNALGSSFCCSTPMGSQSFNAKSLGTKRPFLPFLTQKTCVERLVLPGSDITMRDNIQHLCNAPNMKAMKLDIKKLDGKVAEQAVQLRVGLKMHGVDSDQSRTWVEFFPTLTSFDVQLNSVTNVPFALRGLCALTKLSITADTLCAEDIENLLGVGTQLESFSLTLTHTNGPALKALCMNELPLTYMSVTTPFFESDKSLGLCTRLKKLKICAKCEMFSGESLVCLKSLKQLEELSIVGCSNWQPILPVLSPSLTRLTIAQTVITGTVFEQILHLPFLQDLTLVMCPNLNALSPVKELSHLTRLTVSMCCQIEKALNTILVPSLPEGLRELNVGFIDESGLEEHHSLKVSLKQLFPRLDIKLAAAESLPLDL